MKLLQFIQARSSYTEKAIQNTIGLLQEDCTIPFIARYRKELTGNLDEVAVGAIEKYKLEFDTLNKRKATIIKALTEQDVLSVAIAKKIELTDSLTELEDIYLPFKKKRKTKGDKARDRGLEPLAKIIMSQRASGLQGIASKYINKEVANTLDAFEGARHIISEWLNERSDIRKEIRWHLQKHAVITTKKIKAVDDDKAQKYKDYLDWSENLSRCPSHRLLAMLRAEKEGFIRIKLELDDIRLLSRINQRILRENSESSVHIESAIKDAYKRLLFPALSNEVLQEYKALADQKAIAVFAKNLKQLLLGAPLGEKNILAIDPGFRTGCKVVCLNAQGDLKYNETIYPHPPKSDSKGAMKKLSSMIDAYKIEAIAIGNGTASRETEHLIKRMRFSKDVQVFVVSEAGASIYSASKIARQEFPDYDITVRGAVSIGRRLADPLAELVKIDAKSIGVGQYQHDVDQALLKSELDAVVSHCVNAVGVNVNTASSSLLQYVSGIGPQLAENIVSYRNEQGSFENRSSIKNVPRLGAKAFEQSAGFLRIKNGSNVLDDTGVHPERYSLVKKIAKDGKLELSMLLQNSDYLEKLDLNTYCTGSIGLLTLEDIINELKKPGVDPRKKASVFTFDKNVRTISDLRIGQLIPGIVNNITNFGCFVDIGIKESGLVHISRLKDGYVSDVSEVVQLHQQVIVKVVEVDIARKRIQLAMNYKSS